MKAQFTSSLHLEEMVNENWMPLKNRDGKQLYKVTQPLSFYSSVLDLVITVETGFVTDLDSTPRLPIVYLCMNAFGDGPATLHDYAYSKALFPRQQCDALLREACIATGVPEWKAELIYLGVRVGGGSHFGGTYTA